MELSIDSIFEKPLEATARTKHIYIIRVYCDWMSTIQCITHNSPDKAIIPYALAVQIFARLVHFFASIVVVARVVVNEQSK